MKTPVDTTVGTTVDTTIDTRIQESLLDIDWRSWCDLVDAKIGFRDLKICSSGEFAQSVSSGSVGGGVGGTSGITSGISSALESTYGTGGTSGTSNGNNGSNESNEIVSLTTNPTCTLRCHVCRKIQDVDVQSKIYLSATCTICMEESDNLIPFSCKHVACGTCVINLAKMFAKEQQSV
jgi:hypothetical protein